MRTILAILSDTHGGHKLGLLNPAVQLHDEGETGQLLPYAPKLTAAQLFLWECYTRWIDIIHAWAAGDEIIVIHNGDLTQGMHFLDSLVSTREADQILIGAANLQPWFSIGVETMYIIAGTGAHVFQEGSSEILIQQLLKREYSDRQIEFAYHVLLNIQSSVQVDIAHHGPNQSSRIWLSGNLARYYLHDLMLRCIASRMTPPNLIVRSHVHSYMNEVVNLYGYEARIIVTPPMMLMGDYGRKATRSSSQITVGMVAVEIVDGICYPPRLFSETLDIRTKVSV